jgi:peroxiredoxin Q/BCP
MAQLRRDYSKFQALETEIVVVGPEDADNFKMYWKSHKLPFIGLPDPTYSVLKRYGQEFNLFKMGRIPAQVLIDKQSIVRFAHYGKSMSDIPENEEILQILETCVDETAMSN